MRALCVIVLPRIMLVAVAGCGGAAGVPVSRPPGPSPGPARVVEAFLDAARERDHGTMAGLFGTADGPIGDRGGTLGCVFRRVGSWIGLGDRCLKAWEVELRLDVIAGILRHESYRVRGEEAVAGRARPATRVQVQVNTGARVVGVPFVVVLTGDGEWLVEEIGLGGLMG